MISKLTIPVICVLILSGLFRTNPSFAQLKAKTATYGNDSLGCVKNLQHTQALLKENKKAEALQPWRWVFAQCPAASENIYIQGAVIYNFLIDNEQDSLKKQFLVDTLMMIYDQRITYFRKEGYVLGRKGVELYNHRPSSAMEAFEILKLSVEIEYRHSRPAILVNYFNIALALNSAGKIDTLAVYKAYDDVRDVLDYNVLNNAKESQLYAEARTDIEKALNEFSPCDEIEARLGPVFLSDTNNVDTIISIIHAFEQRQCMGSRLYIYLIHRIYTMNPSGKSALMAGMFFKTGNHPSLAIKYLQTATRSKDTAATYDAYLALGDLFLNTYNDNANASIQAEMAARERPEKAAPYLFLGDLYLRSVKGCGNTDLERYAMYWIAADQFAQAKSIEPALAGMADERIKDIASHYPDATFLSSQKLKAGDAYTVGCWLSKPTTVKVKP